MQSSKAKYKLYKALARERLLGHYGITIAPTLLVFLAAILLNIPFSNILNLGITYHNAPRILMGFLGEIVIWMLFFVALMALDHVHLKAGRKQETGIKDLLYPFRNRPDHFLGLSSVWLLISVLCALPGLICTVTAHVSAGNTDTEIPLAHIYLPVVTPALVIGFLLLAAGFVVWIILMLGYSQSGRIMLDDPDISVLTALHRSQTMMKKRKGSLFKLYLSFLGWFFFGLLSLGIIYLWIWPYMVQSVTQFYRIANGEEEDNQYF